MRTRRPPLHQRFKPWGWLRSRLRRLLFEQYRRLLETDDGRQIAHRALFVRPTRCLDLDPARFGPPSAVYPDLEAAADPPGSEREDRRTLFITGRFRSGSTLLWNLFRKTGMFTAYYEPFNERRWFDPSTRGDRVDPSHLSVPDYWREYEGLERLTDLYSIEWHSRELYLTADTWHPRMKVFLQTLIDSAPRRPVLQFNRVDFRLPWLRAEFPTSQIIHLYRHPRDQWISALMQSRTAVGPDAVMASFADHDHFYLRLWASDLQYRFPFLGQAEDQHPYRTFYYLWRLSYLFGRQYADHSISYEDLVRDPAATFGALLDGVGASVGNLEEIVALVKQPTLGKWKSYAESGWFLEQEAACEEVLADFLQQPASPSIR